VSQDQDTVRIGLRNLTRHSRRTLLTGAMVALGVAALIFFRGYIVAINDMMLDMVVNTLTVPIQVEREGASASLGVPPLALDLPESMGASLRAVPGIVGATPRVRFGAYLFNGDKSSLVVVQAVDPEHETKVAPRGPGAGHRDEVPEDAAASGLEGAAITSVDDDTIIVGGGVARSLGIKLGDTVSLMARTQKGSTDAIEGVVRGIHHAGDPELDKRLVVMSLRRAQKVLHMPDRVTSFGLAAGSRSEIAGAMVAVQKQIANSDPPTEARTWEQLAPYYRDVVTLQNDIMKIVMGVVFILVLAGIVNTMMMSVFERQREIGTLMALGFRRRTILLLFMVEAVGLGIISGLAGALLGLLIVSVTHYTGIPFTVPAIGTIYARPVLDVTYLAANVLLAMVTALAAGLYPAFRASRLQPVEALRAI